MISQMPRTAAMQVADDADGLQPALCGTSRLEATTRPAMIRAKLMRLELRSRVLIRLSRCSCWIVDLDIALAQLAEDDVQVVRQSRHQVAGVLGHPAQVAQQPPGLQVPQARLAGKTPQSLHNAEIRVQRPGERLDRGDGLEHEGELGGQADVVRAKQIEGPGDNRPEGNAPERHVLIHVDDLLRPRDQLGAVGPLLQHVPAFQGPGDPRRIVVHDGQDHLVEQLAVRQARAGRPGRSRSGPGRCPAAGRSCRDAGPCGRSPGRRSAAGRNSLPRRATTLQSSPCS